MPLDHLRKTDCGVDSTYAQRSTVGDRGCSTIKRAVLRSQVHQRRRANRHFYYSWNLHHLDGRAPNTTLLIQPLAFAVDLQTSAVDEEMEWFVTTNRLR